MAANLGTLSAVSCGRRDESNSFDFLGHYECIWECLQENKVREEVSTGAITLTLTLTLTLTITFTLMFMLCLSFIVYIDAICSLED